MGDVGRWKKCNVSGLYQTQIFPCKETFVPCLRLFWFRHLVSVPPGHHPREVMRRRPCGRSRIRCRDYNYCLAWKHLAISVEDQDEVSRERTVWVFLPPKPVSESVSTETQAFISSIGKQKKNELLSIGVDLNKVLSGLEFYFINKCKPFHSYYWIRKHINTHTPDREHLSHMEVV